MLGNVKLEWMGRGKGADYYIDLFKTEDGNQVIIGTMKDDPELREHVAQGRCVTVGLPETQKTP